MKTTKRKSSKPIESVVFRDKERDYVFAVAMKYVKDEDEAADVTQDALLNAYRHRASFRGDSRFTTWLYRVAATTALMHLRKKRRAKVALPPTREGEDGQIEDMTDTLVALGPTPEEETSAHEQLVLARHRLDEMGEKYGSIFEMRFGGGYSEAEIAKKLHLNVATVKTRAYRARAALRDELANAA